MRVTILTCGSLGDVQPYIALGLGLQAAGHIVCIATHGLYETLIRSRGLGFFPVEGNPRDILETEVGRQWLDTSRNPVRFMRGLIRVVEPLMYQVIIQFWHACQDAEAIIVSGLGFYAGYHIAEKMKVPLLLAFYLPHSPTRVFPSPIIWTETPLGSTFNLLTHCLAGQLFWQPFRSSLNKLRREVFDLRPLPFWGVVREIYAERWPILYGYSPTVLGKPPEWGDRIHVTGYWFLDYSANWQPPTDLTDFLKAGPPSVYIGFGSMDNRAPEATTELVLKALAGAKQRGVLLTGWGGLSQADLPDYVFKSEFIPHDWLFPRMARAWRCWGLGRLCQLLDLQVRVPALEDGTQFAV